MSKQNEHRNKLSYAEIINNISEMVKQKNEELFAEIKLEFSKLRVDIAKLETRVRDLNPKNIVLPNIEQKSADANIEQKSADANVEQKSADAKIINSMLYFRHKYMTDEAFRAREIRPLSEEIKTKIDKISDANKRLAAESLETWRILTNPQKLEFKKEFANWKDQIA